MIKTQLYWVNGFGGTVQSISPYEHQLSAAKFGQIGNLWAAANVQQAFHRSSWKGIVQVMPSLIPFSKFSLGSGSSIRFWLDPWIYSIPLESRFPRLFNLSILKDGLVSSFFSSPLTGISTFGETSVTQKFKNLRHFLISFINFSPLPLVLTSEFGPSFHPAPFCVLFLPCHLIAPFRPSVPCKTIWSPSKVQGFLWKLALRRGPTIDITQSFNPHLTLFPNSCPLCLYAEESNDHLFLHCRFS